MVVVSLQFRRGRFRRRRQPQCSECGVRKDDVGVTEGTPESACFPDGEAIRRAAKLKPGAKTIRSRRRAKWGFLLVVGVISLLLTYVLTEPGSPIAPGTRGITLAGNKFLRDGRPFLPQGFNTIATLRSRSCAKRTTAAAADNFGARELRTAKTLWDANTIRFQVSQPVLAGPSGAAYAAEVQTHVDMARDDGLVIVISMQDESVACGHAQPLPGPDTEAAWSTLIDHSALRSDPYVMFELFNEPQNSPITTATTDPEQETWVDWLEGGREIEPDPSQSWAAYRPVGFQKLVDYMRDTLHVTNVLIVDGASYAEQLEGMPVLRDPGAGYEIAYGVHPYFYTEGQNGWNKRFGYLTGSHAVIATEWNYTAKECGTRAEEIAPRFLAYMRFVVHVGILGQALDVFRKDLMAGRSLAPTECGTASPGGGYDFLHDYLEPTSPGPTVPAG